MESELNFGPLLVEMKHCSSEKAVINEYVVAYNKATDSSITVDDILGDTSIDKDKIDQTSVAGSTLYQVLKNKEDAAPAPEPEPEPEPAPASQNKTGSVTSGTNLPRRPLMPVWRARRQGPSIRKGQFST